MEEFFEIDSSDAAVQEVPGALMVICTKSGGCPSICLMFNPFAVFRLRSLLTTTLFTHSYLYVMPMSKAFCFRLE